MSASTTTIPVGSWVLVTGATGFVASHLIGQFLHRGYKVRGTARDIASASWLIEELYKSYAESGSFELVAVPDIAALHAFDEAVRGVSAIAHVAFVLSSSPEPAKTIAPSEGSVRAIMSAASKEPSVKEVVFTSSIMAVALPIASNAVRVDRDTWNDAVVEMVSAPPPYHPSHAMFVYAAGKYAAEKEVWRLVDETKPNFNVNVICPFGIVGEPLHKKHVESPANWISIISKGQKEQLDAFPASFFSDVQDVATLHTALILDPEVKNTRLHAWGYPTHWNDFFTILRRLRPQKQFIDDYPNPEYLPMYTDQSESLRLLQKWGNRAGWKELEISIRESVESKYLDL
ncbi:NADPH-dependent aldehyde reductase [Fusarium heterosporum]|uniref:NADPH-dependent aldehyde reductase n=1 Tax=Fusarium heterosporum TaxID=42747 RepID=A0A8H5TDH7_FUSHE|nr:NADPH-dependent aldehyde reductase [Fusarium heterosporum]